MGLFGYDTTNPQAEKDCPRCGGTGSIGGLMGKQNCPNNCKNGKVKK